MEPGFNVYRVLESGEVIEISWRPSLQGAEQLVHDLKECWPGEYGIREAAGKKMRWEAYMKPVYRWLN